MSIARYAVVDSAGRVENVVMWDGVSDFPVSDGTTLVDVGDQPVGAGWTCTDGSFTAPQSEGEAPAATPSGPRYVRLATIHGRLEAAGKWGAFADGLDKLPASKRWQIVTLQEGVASDDPDAAELLTAIGCDPAAILAE